MLIIIILCLSLCSFVEPALMITAGPGVGAPGMMPPGMMPPTGQPPMGFPPGGPMPGGPGGFGQF